MEQIAISKFKATCLAVIDQVNKTGESVQITKRGVPVATISPSAVVKKEPRKLGWMEGQFTIVGDIISPIIDLNDIEAYKD
jgi:prevent-host-death family protein